jgi:hypothetical protein
MSALRLINETISTSDVASVTVTDLFTDDFDIYKVVLTEFETSSTAVYGQHRLVNSAGSVVTSSNYDYAYLNMLAFSTFGEGKATNSSYIRGLVTDPQVESDGAGVVIYVFNPTNTNSYTFMLHQSSYYNTGNGTQTDKGIAVLKTTEKITGMNFFFSGGNIDGLTIRTYGLRVDNG